MLCSWFLYIIDALLKFIFFFFCATMGELYFWSFGTIFPTGLGKIGTRRLDSCYYISISPIFLCVVPLSLFSQPSVFQGELLNM